MTTPSQLLASKAPWCLGHLFSSPPGHQVARTLSSRISQIPFLLSCSAAPLDVARSLPGVTAGAAVSSPTSLHSEAAPSTVAKGTMFPEKPDAVTLLLKTLPVFLFRVKARAGGLETLRDPLRLPHLLLRSHCLPLTLSAPLQQQWPVSPQSLTVHRPLQVLTLGAPACEARPSAGACSSAS